MKKTLAFAGSNSAKSINHRLIEIVAPMLEGVDVIRLTDYDVVQFNRDLLEEGGTPENIGRLYDLIQQYDNLIIAVPEYNGLPSSFLKNIYDWLTRHIKGNTRFLEGKKLVVLSTSPGEKGGVTAVENFRSALQYSGAHLVGTFSLGKFYSKVNENNELIHERSKQRLQAMLQRLMD